MALQTCLQLFFYDFPTGTSGFTFFFHKLYLYLILNEIMQVYKTGLGKKTLYIFRIVGSHGPDAHGP